MTEADVAAKKTRWTGISIATEDAPIYKAFGLDMIASLGNPMS